MTASLCCKQAAKRAGLAGPLDLPEGLVLLDNKASEIQQRRGEKKCRNKPCAVCTHARV